MAWYLGKAVTGGSVLLFEADQADFTSKQMIEVKQYYDLSSLLIAHSAGIELKFTPYKNKTTYIKFSYIEPHSDSFGSINIEQIKPKNKKPTFNETTVKFINDVSKNIMRIERL
jgi:hypothetical protein